MHGRTLVGVRVADLLESGNLLLMEGKVLGQVLGLLLSLGSALAGLGQLLLAPRLPLSQPQQRRLLQQYTSSLG